MKKLIVITIVLLATVVFAAQTGNVLISWNANTEADLAGYYVYFNNVQVGNVVAPARTWAGSVTFVEGNNVAQVAAYDKCSPIPNTSAKSVVTLASTLVFDSTPPTVPTGCAVQAQ